MNESANKSTVRCKIKGQPLIFKNVLKKNKITMHAYHGRTFVGNRCHKYPTICHTWCLPKCCGENLFSWVTMSKCKQRHMTLHPNIKSWMSCSQECTRALHMHCQLQKKKSMTLTVTSSDTWISTDLTLRSRKSFQSNTFWSATAQISFSSGSLDLVSWWAGRRRDACFYQRTQS